MSDKKMSPELQTAIRRSPEYTAPSEELVALRAEVAVWRRAVRWETVNTENHYHLQVGGVIVGVVLFVDRWSAMTMGTHYLELGSRDAACAKLCEVLGLPVVLPTAPARQ